MALASVRSAKDLASSVTHWVERSFDGAPVGVNVIVPDRRGALRAIPPESRGRGHDQVRARRRTAFAACRPVRAELGGVQDSVAIFPIPGEWNPLGLLEVRAHIAAIEDRWSFLDTLTSMLAPALALQRAQAAQRRANGRGRSSKRDEMARRVHLAAIWTAHEFKTPLAAASISLQYLLEPGREVGAQERELIERSHRKIERLSRTVDTLLSHAGGAEILPFERTDLSTIARDAAVSAFPGAGGRLKVETPHPVTVNGVPLLLRGAVANLVKNAAAYSPPGGTVTVSVHAAARKALVRVDDQGPGVPKNEREAIFAPMVRGSAGRTKGSGSGLGLFIAHQAVAAHGGRIWVRANGTGSSFCFEIPIGDVAR